MHEESLDVGQVAGLVAYVADAFLVYEAGESVEDVLNSFIPRDEIDLFDCRSPSILHLKRLIRQARRTS